MQKVWDLEITYLIIFCAIKVSHIKLINYNIKWISYNKLEIIIINVKREKYDKT